MRDSVDYLFALSDPELVLYWQAFGEFPTNDRRQRQRVCELVDLAVAEPPVRTVRDLQRIGGAKWRKAVAAVA